MGAGRLGGYIITWFIAIMSRGMSMWKRPVASSLDVSISTRDREWKVGNRTKSCYVSSANWNEKTGYEIFDEFQEAFWHRQNGAHPKRAISCMGRRFRRGIRGRLELS